MKIILVLSLLLWSPLYGQEYSKLLTPDQKVIPNKINGIVYESGNWEQESYEKALVSKGNHRAVVHTPVGENFVRLRFPWRRNDPEPEKKALWLINGQSGERIHSFWVLNADREWLDLVFQPDPEATTYYLYYLPFKTSGGNYPNVTYLPFEKTGDPPVPFTEPESLPKARVVSVQSIDSFNSFFPMEVIALEEEVEGVIKEGSEDYFVFPEYRNHPIRMTKFLPYHWIKRGFKKGIADQLMKGEFYAFQLGVYAARRNLQNLRISYSDLSSTEGSIISRQQFQCINIDGISQEGQPFQKNIDVSKGQVQPLWIGLQIPLEAAPGLYKGRITLQPESEKLTEIDLEFTVSDQQIKDFGDDQPENMSRLRWLNSRLGSNEDFIVSPYLPVSVNNRTLHILGREIVLSPLGLPGQINSFFSREMTSLNNLPEPILEEPIQLQVVHEGKPVEWNSEGFNLRTVSRGKTEWHSINNSISLSLQVMGSLEYDGMLNYELALTAKEDLDIEDIRLEVPYTVDAAKYILGLGHKGSRRPEIIDWKWDVKKHQEGLWLGNVHKGLQYVLRDKNYERPLNTNFYQEKPLNLPPSWHNEGKGGIRVTGSKDTVVCSNYSGPRRMSRGETLNFHIRFLVTPFKTIDLESHFKTRFVHKYEPIQSVASWGGTVVNVHHANEINPYINYPFYSLIKQKEYIDEAHENGIRVKLYNTIRELTYKCYEIFALRSLGDEIFNDGSGGGHPWLQEHLIDHYHSAWHAWRVNDASILNKGASRWTNYYIEGLNWLAKNQEIDGLYLDDIAFSRETVKRIVSVLNEQRDQVIIDLHSANQFNPRDGFINSAFLYMEHFPFINRLWFGEYFEYDLGPDYWLTEVSGIPFGLTGEMLQDGGHPYRGMLYGMTTRMYGKFDPRPLWKMFDEIEIHKGKMYGYWLEDCPVETGDERILATVYEMEGKVLIVLASWADSNRAINLEVDWDKFGIDPHQNQNLEIPAIENLQEASIQKIDSPLLVRANRGLFLLYNK